MSWITFWGWFALGNIVGALVAYVLIAITLYRALNR